MIEDRFLQVRILSFDDHLNGRTSEANCIFNAGDLNCFPAGHYHLFYLTFLIFEHYW